MRRMRTGLLTAVILALLAAPSLFAQVAPTLNGATGLFVLPNAEFLPHGQFSFGLAYDVQALTAAPSLAYPTGTDDPMRYSTSKLGMTIGFGLLSNMEGTLSFGQRSYRADDRAWSGIINGFDRTGEIRHDESDKVRIGTKLLVNPNTEQVKLVLTGGMWIPTQSKNDASALSTHRTDWDLGMTLNYKVLTVGASWFLPAPRSDTFRLSNQVTFGLGVNVPIVPGVFRGIAELNRVHFDGGDSKPDDFSEATLGGRVAIGKSGFVASAAVRANIDRWIKYGSSPSPIGGLIQLAFMPQPSPIPAPMAPALAPEPEPAPTPAEPAPAPTSEEPGRPPAPAPVFVSPAPKPETSTTDEILFDAGKSRLTNIAKAILDGVALRLKNNLSATCTVVGHSDPKEKGGDHTKLGLARAEAAKDYLLKRHGIDGSRIRTESEGDSGAGADATRNRRSVVSVTFP